MNIVQQVPPRIPLANPSFRDVMDLHTLEVMLALSCHAIGTISDVTNLSANQTVTATINYLRTFNIQDPVSGQLTQQTQNYGAVTGPLMILGGGGGTLTFPVAIGDTCLILFNDRDFSQWFSTGQVLPVPTQRAHSQSDPIIFVGLRSLTDSLANFDSQRAVMSYNNAMVGVGNQSKVKIANANYTLNTLLQNILTQLENLATACSTLTVTGVQSGSGTSAVPSNAATFTTISTQLTSLATELEGLLE